MDLNGVGQILWQLKLLANQGGSSDAQTSASSTNLRDTQFELIEHLLLAIVRCQGYTAVIQHGLQLIDVFGYRPRIVRCVILAMCNTVRYQECYQLLERWGQVEGNSQAMIASKQIVEGFLVAIGSGVKPALILGDLEEGLGLRSTTLGSDFDESGNCSILSNFLNSSRSGTPSFGSNHAQVPTLPAPDMARNVAQQFLGVDSSPEMKSYQAASQHSLHPYLNKLRKQVNSSGSGGSKIFVEKLEGVKIKCFTDADAVVRGRDHRWAFAVNSREAVRTVSLLNDSTRENFNITGAYFYHTENKTINLFDIHTSNNIPNLQVLNTFVPADLLRSFGGWPSCFTYKIEIRFKGFSPGKYKQTIVFDFKKEPKIARHISAEYLSVSASTSTVVSGTSTPVTLPVNNIIPFKEQECRSTSSTPASTSFFAPLVPITPVPAPEWHKNTGPTLLHRSNYCCAQERIINCEMQFLQTHLRQNSMVQSMKLTKSYIMEKKFGNEMKLADEGEMFLLMEIGSSNFKDTIFGKLVSQHCSCVLISNVASPTRSYTCKVKEKMQDKWIIIVDLNQVLDLGLRLDQSFQFKIEFILDIAHFADLSSLIGLISEIELQILFPDVARKIDFTIDTFDGTLQEGLFSLNPRQVDAFNVITKLPLAMPYVPPILLIGPPGSGKTHTLTESIKKVLMSQPASRLLICTQSNGSANRYLETFDEWIKSGLKVKMIRVYDPEHNSFEDIPSVAKRYCTLSLDFNLQVPRKEEIQRVNIVITTINSTSVLTKVGTIDLGKNYFSHIIIDEAGNQLEVDLIAPIFLANPNTRIVFSGDQSSYNQLSSVSSNIMERLNLHYPDGHLCKIVLNETYHSHPDILKFVGDHFSPVKLRCSSSQTAHSRYMPLTYFAVKGGEVKGRTSFSNMSEVLEISKFVQNLVSSWPAQWGRYQEPNSITVFTNYDDQIVSLRKQLRSIGLGFVAVDGIWNLKANMIRVVILSTVRSYDSNSPVVDDSGFFNNDRLIYNALARTQCLFAVFGDPSLCAFGLSCDIWKAFISAAALSEINNVKTDRSYFSEGAVTKARNGDEDQPTFQLFPKSPPGFAQAQPICRPIAAPSMSMAPARPLTFNSIASASEDLAMSRFMQAGRVTPFADSIQSKLGESLLAQLNAGIVNVNGHMNGDTSRDGGFYTPPPRPSSTNSNYRMNSLPPRLMKEKSNRSRNKKPSNETKKTNGTSMNGLANGKRGNDSNSTNYKKKPGGANLNEIIMESVTHKLDNMGLGLQQTNLPNDQEYDAEGLKSNDDWVEVKKTKKSKRGNKKNANAISDAVMDEPVTMDEKVKCLMDMGYEKRVAIKALQCTDKDLSKSIELLVSGSGTGFTTN